MRRHVRELGHAGFGLLELVISILLVALLTCAVAVYYREQMDENRLKIVHHDLEFLRRQLAIHRMGHPGPLPGLHQLEGLREGALDDPWGRPYLLLPEEPALLVCVGPDGILGESAEAAADDVRVPLGQALRDWIPAGPDAGASGTETVSTGYQVHWIHPARGGAAVARLASMVPHDERRLGGLGVHPENPHCTAEAGGPALYFAVMIRLGADHRPESELDRLELRRIAHRMDPVIFISGPGGSERLQATVSPPLPCNLSREMQNHVDSPVTPSSVRYDPQDWYLVYRRPLPRNPDGTTNIDVTMVGIGADAVHGEDQRGRDPLFWERLLLTFYRVPLVEDLCPGDYHVQATILGGSGATLVASTLEFAISPGESLRLESSNLPEGSQVHDLPSQLEVTFSTSFPAHDVVRAASRGGDLELSAWCDETLLHLSSPPEAVGRDRFRCAFLLPPFLAMGPHGLRIHLRYRSPEHPAGLQICERWSFHRLRR